MPDVSRVIAWADAGQEPFVREAAAHRSLRLGAIGSSTAATAADLARDLEADRFDDLRQAVANADADLIWLFGADHVDRDLLRLICEVDVTAFTCHPQPATIGESLPSAGRALPRFVPLMRCSGGFRAAAQVLGDFGAVDALGVAFRSGRAHGGDLFARLYDAMDTIAYLCGDALALDAALAGPHASPESLAAFHGHMTINIRFGDNRCASAALSDQAGAWFRGVTMLGEAGCLRINDDGFEWLDPAGRLVDSHIEDQSLSPGELAAETVVRIMDGRDSLNAPLGIEDHARLLALCEAARLSCRTGHGEAPSKVLEMLSRP